ncbi:hypothetical protein Cni_G09135 [Canna indica]|uniref:Transmembrane protein 53 n=1 Tax=Canna indica TaxID=4628 RepID=A0AAQ3K549_9LILI|nr:hypothetical protein Cni_G09135 [Canna indica]
MEASVRLLGSAAAFHRQLRLITAPSLSLSLPNANPRFPRSSIALQPRSRFATADFFRSPPAHSSLPLAPLLSLSNLFASVSSPDRVLASDSDPQGGFFHWDRHQAVLERGDPQFCNDKGPIWTVVLLGWLGAEPKHMNKYAALYSSNGIRPVRFVISVKELLGLDMGKRVQEKIARFTQELVSWCSETEEGRERCLLFHTFSNTGWLTYGKILDNLQTRPDIIQKIKGCVVDSGAAPEISPQVWAAGFCAALFKKRSSLVYSSVEDIELAKVDVKMNNLGSKDNSSTFTEILVLSLLEKLFAIVLELPDVNKRLRKIISILSDKQPPCPQLYLYSSADKVIPVNSVEKFIKEQKASGRIVHAHDFGSSPHVDHLRSFPQVYSTKISEFLKECCSRVAVI